MLYKLLSNPPFHATKWQKKIIQIPLPASWCLGGHAQCSFKIFHKVTGYYQWKWWHHTYALLLVEELSTEEKVREHTANILYLSWCSNNCKLSSHDTLVKKGTKLKSIKMSTSMAVVISELCMKSAKFLMWYSVPISTCSPARYFAKPAAYQVWLQWIKVAQFICVPVVIN